MGVRRQIYLDERDNRLLEAQSKRTGLSVSELVRQAIHKCYGTGPRLTWEQLFALSVPPNLQGGDAWVYDPLFDDEWIDEILDEYERTQSETGPADDKYEQFQRTESEATPVEDAR